MEQGEIMALSRLQELLKINEKAPVSGANKKRAVPALTEKQIALYGGITKANGFTLEAALKMYKSK